LAKRNALDAWVRLPGPLANNIDPVPFTTGTVLVNPLAASSTPDFRPVAGSPALHGADFVNNPLLQPPHVAQHEPGGQPAIPVYPNPLRTGRLHFGRPVETYQIFDLRGQVVAAGFQTDQVVLDGLASGLYFIQLEGEVQKLVLAWE